MWTFLRAARFQGARFQGLALVEVSRCECLRRKWDATKEVLRQRLVGELVGCVQAIWAECLAAQECLCRRGGKTRLA